MHRLVIVAFVYLVCGAAAGPLRAMDDPPGYTLQNDLISLNGREGTFQSLRIVLRLAPARRSIPEFRMRNSVCG